MKNHCGFIIYYFLGAASENGIFLTANGATNEMPLCPGVVQFTCTAINLASGSLRWFHNSRDTEIPELNYVYASAHTFPRPVDVVPAIQSLGFINMTISDATFDESSNVFNYTAQLVVDVEVLLNAGFHSLECGSLQVRESFIINIQGLL